MKRKKNKMKKRISLIVAAVLAVGSAVPLADYVMELRGGFARAWCQVFC